MNRFVLSACALFFAFFSGLTDARAAGRGAEEKPAGAGAEQEADRPINALIAHATKDAAVRKDMAKRFVLFSVNNGYVTKRAADNLGSRLEKPAEAWLEERRTTGGDAWKAAVELFYILGDTALPAWATSDPALKAGWPDPGLDKLIERLKPWTVKAGSGADGSSRGATQFDLDNRDVGNWMQDFLNEASRYAFEIVEESNPVSREMKERDILAHEQQSPVQADTGPRKQRWAASAGFSAEELLEGGAEVATLYQEGDKTSRRISVKLSTKKTDDGMVNEIAICDLTFPDDRFCQRFPIKTSGDSQTFALDDRKPGMRQYTLSFEPTQEGEVNIKFGREAAVAEGKGPVIETTLRGLARARAQHVVDMGRVVDIGGVDYYLAGQIAGSSGQHLYYPMSIKKDLAEGKLSDLTPEFAATVVTRVNGIDKLAQGKISLGKVKGEDYHTYYDAEQRRFKIGKGPGDAPPPAATTNPAPGGGDPAGGGNPTGGGAGNSLDDQFLQKGYYRPVDEINKNVKPIGKIRIHKITPEGEKWLEKEHPIDAWQRTHVLIIPEVGYANYHPNQLADAAGEYKINDLKLLGEEGGATKYLKTVFSRGVLYHSLRQPSAKLGLTLVGRIVTVEGVKTIDRDKPVDAKDVDLVYDALKEVLPAKDVQQAMRNLAEVMKGHEATYIYSEKGLLIVALKPGPNREFWPNIDKPADAGGSFPNATGQGSTIFQGATGAPPDPLPDQAEVGPPDAKENIKVYPGCDGKCKKAEAALYVNDTEQGKGRKWYIMFNFVVQGKKYRSLFIQLPLTDKPGGDGVQFPSSANPPLDINGAGITEHKKTEDLMSTGTHGGWVSGEKPNKDKGVFAVFMAARSPGNRTSAKDNCLGPLFWWGMDQAAAQKACENDSL